MLGELIPLLISAVLVIGGAILLVIGVIKKNKIHAVRGILLIVLGGILFFLLFLIISAGVH